MFRSIAVARNERYAHLVDGKFQSLLGPGSHFVWTLSGNHEFVKFDAVVDILAIKSDDPIPADHPDITLIRVDADHAALVISKSGSPTMLSEDGTYRAWYPPEAITMFDIAAKPTPLADSDRLFKSERGNWTEETASTSHAVVLTQHGRAIEALPPGRFRTFKKGPWGLVAVDLALQSLDIAHQDLLTGDQVAIRVKPAVAYRVVEPLTFVREGQAANHVYTAVQLALREVVASRELDALLTDKDALSQALRERAVAHLPAVGLALEVVSVKDIILPGDVKEMLQRVVVAKKEAEALAIKRREEVAQTRQLANTAKMLENNPVLLRLKELEHLTELAGKIDKLTVVGGGDLVREVMLRGVEKPE